MRELSDNIMDIAQNSISAGAALTEVHVKVSHQEDLITLTFKDDGCGMSEEALKRVFEKFYQGDNSHSKDGNGLGLALVKKILDFSGGRINVESVEGKGSTFTIYIPLAV